MGTQLDSTAVLAEFAPLLHDRLPSTLPSSPESEPSAKRARFDEDWHNDTTQLTTLPPLKVDVEEASDSDSSHQPHTASTLSETRDDSEERNSSTSPSAPQSQERTIPNHSATTSTVPAQQILSNSSSAFTATSAMTVKTKAVQPISTESKFESFAEFEESFELWKRVYHHPFRVASSETLREPDGSVNQVFKYRYIVYHCAHYGQPRMRGVGKRPNQSYLPCGCRAMLRLNYNFNEKVLKITTLNDQHAEHEVSAESFAKVSSKIRRSPVGSPSIRRSSSQKASRDSPQSASTATPSPSDSSTVHAMGSSLAAITMAIQQQQRLAAAALLAQHKENLAYGQQHNQQPLLCSPPPGLPRPTPQAPQSTPILPLNMLNMFMPPLFFPSPSHGLVAQALPPAAEPSPALEALQHTLPRPTPDAPSHVADPSKVKNEVDGKNPEMRELLTTMTEALESAPIEEFEQRREQAMALIQQWKTQSG